MKVVLEHHFKDTCFDWDELLEDCEKFNTFCSRLSKQSGKYPDRYDPNVYKGDGLEIFAEYFFKINCVMYGIYDYTVVKGQDYGVDGYGIGTNGNPATSQVKFRGQYDYELSGKEDGLFSFTQTSMLRYHVKPEDSSNMILLSNADSLNHFTDHEMFMNKVRFVGRDEIRKIVDGNVMFWRYFRESIEKSKIGGEISIPEKCRPKNKIILREHQLNACDIIEITDKGQIILPTATGKSYIIAESNYRQIKKNQTSISLISSPRILLEFQLLKTTIDYLRYKNIDVHCINVNSGQFNDKDEEFLKTLKAVGLPYRQIKSTTNPSEIKESCEIAKKENVPLIICSTFQSLERVYNSGVAIDVCYFDEAHFLVNKEFASVMDNFYNSRIFSFSATQHITDSDDGLGMNNIKRFGPVIFTKSAKEMIEAGEMVEPRIHIVDTEIFVNYDSLELDYECLAQSIIEAFFAHKKLVKEGSAYPEMIGAKLLVVNEGQLSLKKFLETKKYKEFIDKNRNTHVFAISSDLGGYIDGKYGVSKDEFLRELQLVPNEDDTLILHVDMLGLGIDVPSITGIMPFRNLGNTNLTQTIGRASRLFEYDRKRLYAEEINKNDLSKFVKPCSWIIIPAYKSIDAKERFEFIILKLRNEYNFIPKEHVVITDGNGIKKEEGFSGPGLPSKNKIFSKSGIESFIHSWETDQYEKNRSFKLNNLKKMTSEELIEWIKQQERLTPET